MAQFKRKIGVVGYGHLGEYLVEQLQTSMDYELCFVWNRTSKSLLGSVSNQYILENLDDFHTKGADLIVEVAHPVITETYGQRFLEHADYMVGSPTALARAEVEAKLRASAVKHGLYIPAGALWGSEDIKKMANRGILQGLKITMTFHPDSLKLMDELKEKNEEAKDKSIVLYDGPVRPLCPLAPNNVNTMAAASLAAHTLGFDKVQGCLIADPSLTDFHIVEVDAWGPGDIATGTPFHVHTTRKNPANPGRVTGSGTYNSFLSSALSAHGKGPGVHLC